jgi:hypothetical protein
VIRQVQAKKSKFGIVAIDSFIHSPLKKSRDRKGAEHHSKNRPKNRSLTVAARGLSHFSTAPVHFTDDDV